MLRFWKSAISQYCHKFQNRIPYQLLILILDSANQHVELFEPLVRSTLVPTFDFIDVQFYESYSRSGETKGSITAYIWLDPSYKTLLNYES